LSKKARCQPQPLLAVNDVQASSRWYQKLLNCKSGHGGEDYEQLLCGKKMILQLHAWDIDHDHALLGKKSLKARGNGMLLWFAVDDFDDTFSRTKKLKAKILLKPHLNTNANHRECWIQDPDGYTVVFAGT
jgi:catechol 2,3-dioxygenase-like lactoylglutathione lyase family enzyme